MTALPPYRAQIQPEWIDYNGHLRDAYYGLVLSYAIDAVMDHLGLDAAYRDRTRCTLYTLELHMHYLREVKQSDPLEVHTDVLDADGKRMHLGSRFLLGAPSGAAAASITAATADVMLLHVHQGEKPAAAPLPPEIERKVASLKLTVAEHGAWGPKSRAIELQRRGAR